MAVPDTDTFKLTDVQSNVPIAGVQGLDEFLDNADASKFDSTYSGAKDNLLNFRNYGATNLKFEYTTTLTNTIKLPLRSGTTVNLTVDWGDGSQSSITSYNDPDTTHTYSLSDTYPIKITGTINSWSYGDGINPTGEELHMGVITNWGEFVFSREGTFKDCENLTVTATDIPAVTATNMNNTFYNCSSMASINGTIAGGGYPSWNMSTVNKMEYMFYNTLVFNQDLSTWNVQNVTSMSNMFAITLFASTSIFNKDLSSWNVSNVTNFSLMFDNAKGFNKNLSAWNMGNATTCIGMFGSFGRPCGLTVANYSNTLIGWGLQSASLQSNVTLDAYGIKYSAAAVDSVTALTANPPNWTINDGGEDSSLMSLQINTNLAAGTNFVLPMDIPTGAASATIDWGDNTTTTFTSSSPASDVAHGYAIGGIKVIHITGSIQGFGFTASATDDREKLTNVYDFGALYQSVATRQFVNCVNVTNIASSSSINGLTNIRKMFFNCNSLSSLGAYTFANATNGESAFEECNVLTSIGNIMLLQSLLNGNRMFFNCNFSSLPTGMTLSSVTTSNQMFRNTPLTSLPSGLLLNNSVNCNSLFNGANLTDLPSGMKFSAASNLISVLGGGFGAGSNSILPSRLSQLYQDMNATNTNTGVIFAAPNSKYDSSGAASRSDLINSQSWVITDDGQV
jgi:hypothetical protein